ncbi:uncharacterized protein METZ01_LOCUS22226 [marine metagenome]|uniref:Uncharacterized protein n=1 Tax=marine metagenome TaxID=408172 RepID=A0A381PQR9_9ZZZZ
MHKSLWFLFLFNSSVLAAELQEETEVKFAIFSSAWGENTDDGLRVVAYNQTQGPIRLNTILFLKEESEDSEQVAVNLNLEIPSLAYADVEFPYIDLLQGNECIERTMAESWKLVEISNYTLNPSVRNLIIEDTDSFRIYQCIENVRTIWTRLANNIQVQYEEWVLFHFESRRDN